MSSFSSLFRGLVVVAAVVAGSAAAQPVNDACANAEPLDVSGGPATSTTATRIDLTAAAVETAFTCAATSVNNSVWYTFTVPSNGTYVIETCGAVTNYDTVLQLYSGTCAGLTAVGTSTTGCNDTAGCGTFDASAISLALTAGTTYYVQVAVFSTVTLDPTLVTALTVRPLLPPANDRCGAGVPSLVLNTPLAFSTNGLTNNDSQLGGILDGGAGPTCFTGLGHSTTAANNTSPGRDVVFSFTPPATGTYSVRLGFNPASVNSVLYMTDSCVPAMTPPQIYAPPQCIAASNRSGGTTTAAEELICLPLTSATPYFIWADETALSTAGTSYELEVTACTAEVEPNDTVATAAPLACPVTGRIATNGEVDFFSLGTNQAGARVYALLEAASAGNAGSASNDFDLRVTSDTDTLEYDDLNADLNFGGSSGAIAGTPLPNLPAYLRVNYFSATTAREPYRLYSVIQPGTPAAESEPNDTLATAGGGTSNYFSGEVATTADVDLFAFDARVGDLLFLALDSQPSRSGSTATGNHTLQLLDATGAVLVSVNDSGTTVNNTVATGALNSTSPALPSETLVYRVRVGGAFFARVGRTSATGTGQYVLSISKDCTTGGGIGAPALSSLTPATGTVSGGTTVTLTGSNFAALAAVTIGGGAAAVVSRTATTLEVLTPPGLEGAVDVVVSNAGGQTATLAGGFLYFAPAGPPTVTSVTPVSGPTAGGTVITVNGLLFKTGAEVRLSVGGAPQQATNVVVVNSTLLRATTPAHAAGLASLTVRNPVDALEGSRADVFTYLAPPTITSVTPNTGFTAGGLTVTIAGTAFRAGAAVRFGANAGTNVVVDPGGSSLTVTTPPALVDGAVSVTVVNTDTQQTVSPGAFTYNYPAPTITTITPAVGFAAGGTIITITGTGFQPAPTVTIGGNPATGVSRLSLTQVTAVTPPGMGGLADVRITNPDAQFATRTGGFRYVAGPAITSVSPARGPVGGGTTITLTGTDFQAGASVQLGGVPAFAVTVTSATTATAVTNGSAAGAVDVVLTNPDTQRATLAGAFTYDAAPTLTAVSPISGTTAGGTVVTLTGTGFGAGTQVRFGTDGATGVTVVSPTQLTALTPAHAVGVVEVRVTSLDSQSATLARAYRFVAPPTVTMAAPGTGDVAGGTLVRVTGSGFGAGTTVRFGGTAATNVSLVSSSELDAVTPAHMPGAVDVEVSTDGAIATLSGGFTYTRGAPTLTGVAPPSGPIAGGTLLTLTGTGFAAGATITVGGVPATDVVIVSNVLARAVVPAHAAGIVDVVFTNDDAQTSTLTGGFTFVAPPSNTVGVADGGSGSLGEAPVGGGGGAGGVSCGCSSFDGSLFGLGLGVLAVLSRRRRSSRS
ncbi:MAG: IPT/TIG domain-containing protein [Archangium sp.]|nr:IPT/TIG domain-containing protein [Archangium sp.]